MTIKEMLNNIKNALYAKDVVLNIHDAINQVYVDGVKAGNVNMEIIQARGQYKSLNARLNAMEGKQVNTWQV